MSGARYFLADVVLSGLLALSDEDCRRLFATFDQIAENPRGMANSVGQDWDGRLIYLSRHGRFEVGYIISPDGTAITFTLLRPRVK